MRSVFCSVKSWGVCLLVGISVWLPGLAQAQSDQWVIHYTSKLGVTDRACFSKECKTAADQYASRLLRVCINRDAKSAGFFAKGEWVVDVGPDGPAVCQERMHADPAKKLLYIQAFFLGDYGTFLGRPAMVRCEPGGRSNVEFDPCFSEMFRPYEANPRFKYLEGYLANKVRDEAKVVEAIDRYMADDFKRQAAKQRENYLADFGAAKSSLAGIRAFEERYAGNDPDGLIPQLVDTRRELLLREYQDRFRALSTPDEMSKFVADYKDNDPELKVPEVRARLEAEQRRQKELADAAARDKARADLKAKLTEYEFQIGWCKRRTVAAREVIAREEEIGRISGFVNKKIMREAGEQIVSCSRNNPQLYADYKRLGGVKAYADIQ